MALHPKQTEVYGMIEGYHEKLEEPARNATGTEKAAFKDWMKSHGVARSTILLSMEPRIHAKYIVVDDVKTLWEKLASTYKSKVKLNIVEIREDHWSIKLQDCGDFNNSTSRIDLISKVLDLVFVEYVITWLWVRAGGYYTGYVSS
jgi:hypothetical protein